ncbi:MAG: Macrolide export ATP-binding/permease protein MacB [Candidatus Accumulibacter regalis]|jgi:putative ABC transport system ATP-binding protein|uniref:Macrolide export ATP-binding/permease protein MacB n=1 Tax=Accumulibacter regalis TaxID=522306 RepID=A0A011P6Z7_ACCRE|nr:MULTISPECIES: ABC transporter ATP-binding protein [unclassified Candidatus Accumulibacter]EXI90748.1 MAG: Macrolide export ATP-binding/permease protein MacB [Candidatus Accumulibacter regalis]MQM33572.1 ABC transporter ATP-binding protein [Candidatus Accumulibacter phosphatis]MBL8367836.1 ABC transporter ATP-binding protein [Accumulibacter sp.]MBN8514458.1 ABC transporter ATP-binding protein [Accumulibacter sp.]MBO3702747.1 ABC transporter ATP-binding protein [Accumulibacter sp.]
MSSALIRVAGLGKSYSTAAGPFPALRGVDLSIAAGEFVAIMGQSGSGKSTFMNLLGCLDTPTSGDYFLLDRNVAHLGRNELASLRNRTIGFVFQGFNLLPRMTLADNVALPLVYAGVERAQRQQRAQQELARVGLAAYADSLPSRISGGQQQRVAIARALVTSPPLILADEPTGNLDSHTSAEIMHLLATLNAAGITIVLVTHEADIAAWAQRQVRFLDGLIVSDVATPARVPGQC